MDIKAFKQQLETMRAETERALTHGKDATKAVELDQTTQGRLSRMDAMQQQQMALAGAERARRKLTQIDAALARVEKDEFGICANCGDDISEARLKLDPTIQTCIECAR